MLTSDATGGPTDPRKQPMPLPPAGAGQLTGAAGQDAWTPSIKAGVQAVRSGVKTHNAVRTAVNRIKNAQADPEPQPDVGPLLRVGGAVMAIGAAPGLYQGALELERGDVKDGVLDLGANAAVATLGTATLVGVSAAARWLGPVGGVAQAAIGVRNLVRDHRAGASTEQQVEDGAQIAFGGMMALSPLAGPAAPVVFAVGAGGSLAVTLYQHRKGLAEFAKNLAQDPVDTLGATAKRAVQGTVSGVARLIRGL